MPHSAHNEYLVIMQTPAYRLSLKTLSMLRKSKRSDAIALALKVASKLGYTVLGVYKLGPNLTEKS